MGYGWTLLSHEHPRITLDSVRGTLDGLAMLGVGSGSTCVVDGVIPDHDARLSMLVDFELNRLVAVATDPFGWTVWFGAELS